MWHKPCRTFHPWCLCIKTRCLWNSVGHPSRLWWDVQSILPHHQSISLHCKLQGSSPCSIVLHIVTHHTQKPLTASEPTAARDFISVSLGVLSLILFFSLLIHFHLNQGGDYLGGCNPKYIFQIYLGLNEMTGISQTMLEMTFSSQKICIFWLKFQWWMFPGA